MSQDSSQLDQYIGYQLFVVIPISIFIIYIKQKIKKLKKRREKHPLTFLWVLALHSVSTRGHVLFGTLFPS